MTTKQKISAAGTYVFDPEDIEQLDELSLTSIVAAIADPAGEPGTVEKESPAETPTDTGATTINQILRAAEPATREDVRVESKSPETADLISPELLFPERMPDRRR